MSTPRPKCAECGKGYGVKIVETRGVRYAKGKPMPAYRGPGIVIRSRASAYPTTDGEMSGWYRIWNGASYFQPYQPFCTLRCALAYARKAYKEAAEDMSAS